MQDSETAKEWGKDGVHDESDIKALLDLSPVGLDMWTECKREVSHYMKRSSEKFENCYEVYRFDNQRSSPRLIGPNQFCSCNMRMAHMSLCVHQLCYDDGKFMLERFRLHLHRKIGVRVVQRPAHLTQHDCVISPGNNRNASLSQQSCAKESGQDDPDVNVCIDLTTHDEDNEGLLTQDHHQEPKAMSKKKSGLTMKL